MKSTKIILDSHLTRRDEALAFVQTGILAAESPTFAGFAVVVDATECDVLEDEFSHEFIELILTRMHAESLNIIEGSEATAEKFNTAATALNLQHKLLIDGAPAYIRPKRTVSTQIFAEAVGEQIAFRRTRHAITGVFAEELVRYNVTATAEQRAVMANEVSKALLADTTRDNEAAMAGRAVTKVLTGHYGDTITVTGPWIENEEVSVNGTTHRLTGIPCPSCRVNPECRGKFYLSNYCVSCGWFDVPF